MAISAANAQATVNAALQTGDQGLNARTWFANPTVSNAIIGAMCGAMAATGGAVFLVGQQFLAVVQMHSSFASKNPVQPGAASMTDPGIVSLLAFVSALGTYFANNAASSPGGQRFDLVAAAAASLV